jgi:hypothetical protein
MNKVWDKWTNGIKIKVILAIKLMPLVKIIK